VPLSLKLVEFWKRQFRHPPTKAQRVFDVLFGIGVPLACLAFDSALKFILKGELTSVVGEWKTYAYSEAMVGILAVGFFVKCRQASPCLSGMLLGVAVLFTVVGLLLLSFWLAIFSRFVFYAFDANTFAHLKDNLVGYLFVVALGIPGLMLLLTGFVFVRNACRYRGDLPRPFRLSAAVVFVAIVILIVPAIPDLLVQMMVPPSPPGV
jgi:hypothetical protein